MKESNHHHPSLTVLQLQSFQLEIITRYTHPKNSTSKVVTSKFQHRGCIQIDYIYLYHKMIASRMSFILFLSLGIIVEHGSGFVHPSFRGVGHPSFRKGQEIRTFYATNQYDCPPNLLVANKKSPIRSQQNLSSSTLFPSFEQLKIHKYQRLRTFTMASSSPPDDGNVERTGLRKVLDAMIGRLKRFFKHIVVSHFEI